MWTKSFIPLKQSLGSNLIISVQFHSECSHYRNNSGMTLWCFTGPGTMQIGLPKTRPSLNASRAVSSHSQVGLAQKTLWIILGTAITLICLDRYVSACSMHAFFIMTDPSRCGPFPMTYRYLHIAWARILYIFINNCQPTQQNKKTDLKWLEMLAKANSKSRHFHLYD